ncbi:sulfotransferase [Novosphingobium sp.]|uniref:sulfotransferase family protein n=1 Tax=Novosphingobium sp. TaxID=1874826 RepID=UPI0025F81079|nr:sulfotransferase [Novosphingobium sp.]MCC6925674.1 sulfotransferase [Novosphingobium sp.]
MTSQLDPKALMQQACDDTGVSDYGDRWFEAPLARLVEEVNRDAGLVSPASSAGVRISSALADRLKLVQYFKDHPEAADEKVDLACAIIGLPRTGSTMVHRLLGAVPGLTALWWWETAFPLPFPGEVPDNPAPRQQAAQQMVDWLLNEWPDFESIDPMDAMAINEEVVLLDRTFLSTTYDSMMPIHDYGYWQAEQDHEPAIRDLYRFMQAIQHQRAGRGEPRRPWVFKTPHYVLGALGGLLKVWPDVKLVMTHRHVGEVLPSYCSMCASLSVGSSATYRKELEGAHWSKRFRDGLERLEVIRATLPPGQVIDVRYEETVRDPVGTGERLLSALGLPVDTANRAALEQCVADNAREARPRHKYSAADFGLTADGITEQFAFYHQRYLTD